MYKYKIPVFIKLYKSIIFVVLVVRVIFTKTCYLQRRNSSGLMMNSLLKIFQVRVDRHATYLGLAGGGLGSIAKIGVTNGLLMGFTVGTVTTGILNSTLWKNKDAIKSDS